MRGHYRNWIPFTYARIYRGLLRAILRTIMRWQRLDDPQEGLTLAIACHARLPEILEANFKMLRRQDLGNVRHILCAFDGPISPRLERVAERLRTKLPGVPMTFLYQSLPQAWLLRVIRWGWVDCWLSYAKCIAATTTRYVMLHDMDAILLDPSFITRRFESIRSRGDHFLGVRWYDFHSITEDDKLIYIVDMVLDAAFLRNRFKPVHLFNHVYRINGKALDLDTLIFPQLATDRKSVIPATEEDWVHPGQVISQYVHLRCKGDGYVGSCDNNLFFIPYFLYLAGDTTVLAKHTRGLLESDTRFIPFLGYLMDIQRLTNVHQLWIRKQIEKLETAIEGEVRAEVEAYLAAIEGHITAAV